MTTPTPQIVRDDAPQPAVDHGDAGQANWPLGLTLVALAIAMASASLLGPLGLDVMTYRTSPTSLNQLLGSDAAALFLVVPLTLLAAVLAVRGQRAAAPLASGVGVFAVYTYAQVVIGQEYLRLPGNVERFFPLLLAVFVLAEAAVVLAWRGLPDNEAPPSRALQRTAGWVLLLLAGFLVLGLHLRGMLIAWSDPGSMVEYASAPTPFWMVKLMDLGIVVPAAVTVGLGLLRGAPWAARLAYPLLTGYTCLGFSVTAMAVTMLVNADPDASWALAAGFALFAVGFLALTLRLYAPLLKGPAEHPVEVSRWAR